MKTLEAISKEVILLLEKQKDFKKKLAFKDYHGFQKVRLTKTKLNLILKKHNIAYDQIQAEIILVNTDLSKEIHQHKQAHAYCTILGQKQHFPRPKHAAAFLRNKWFSVKEGQTIDIPPKTAHGFTVKDKGILYFLSLQNPPIEKKNGEDDYFTSSFL